MQQYSRPRVRYLKGEPSTPAITDTRQHFVIHAGRLRQLPTDHFHAGTRPANTRMIIVAASPRPTALLHDTKVKNRRTAAKEKQSQNQKQRHHDQRDLTSHSIPAGGAERNEHPRID